MTTVTSAQAFESAAADYVVKLTGRIDLSTGSFNGGHNFTL
jgi:hypothetical protein